jgi:hypothetical protein
MFFDYSLILGHYAYAPELRYILSPELSQKEFCRHTTYRIVNGTKDGIYSFSNI